MGLIKNVFYIAKEVLKKAVVKLANKMARFFQKALNMMRIVLERLAVKVRGVILGAAHFFRKIGAEYQEGVKNYSLEEEIGEWNETTVTREISFEDLPPQYRGIEHEFEIDDTRELNSALMY